MSIITFLSASVPLTKSFRQNTDGSIKKEPYPQIALFTSHDEEVNGVLDLFEAIKKHAAEGHCLLKGKIARPLVNEVRRSTTTTNDRTDWVCLDFDRHNCASIDEALVGLGLGDISYVLQYSASHGLPDCEDTQSAHVFMLLDKEIPAPDLKAWLMNMNLTYLRSDIRLSRSKVVLSWPLDITTCQNDKLLYIAPPRFSRMTDPLSRRIEVVKK